MKIAGIYLILNTINNKVYIGSSINIESRWYEHKWKLNKNRHGSKHLQATWNKYGKENFEFKIIEEILDKTKLIEREQYWLDFYKSYIRENGYNIRSIANSNLRIKLTEEHKRAIGLSNSVSMIGNKSRLGFKNSPEHIEKIRQGHIGRITPLETRQKQCLAKRPNSLLPLGVYFDSFNNRWVVKIKPYYKAFSVNKIRNFEQAKQWALLYRKSLEDVF